MQRSVPARGALLASAFAASHASQLATTPHGFAQCVRPRIAITPSVQPASSPSLLQVLIAGTVIYNALIKLPYLAYPEAEAAPAKVVEGSEEASVGLLSAEGSLNAAGGEAGAGDAHEEATALNLATSTVEYTPVMRKVVDIKKR